VPYGKAIFMPIINWISIMPEDGTTDRDLLSTAKQKIDTVQNLSITINHKESMLSPTSTELLPVYLNSIFQKIIFLAEQKARQFAYQMDIGSFSCQEEIT